MCGRFTLTLPPELLAEIFGLAELPRTQPRWNIAPSQQVAVIRETGEGRRLDLLKWGLVPSWAKDPAIGNRLINARAETVASKPSFRAAFRTRRCLIPADGFYEWQTVDGKKRPWHIHRQDGRPLAFAGLWERWHVPDQPELETCTIITTVANETMRPLHDRMPVILNEGAFTRWLAPSPASPDDLNIMLVPPPADLLTAYPVSPLVNNPRNDRPDCLKPEAES